jgi:hypothetical protein
MTMQGRISQWKWMAQKDRRLKKEGETFFGDYRRSATDCQ